MATDDDAGADEHGAAPKIQQRRSRRLSDKILLVFHAACDTGELHVARQLLVTLEGMMASPGDSSPTDRRRTTQALVAAHERLWNLEHGVTAA